MHAKYRVMILRIVGCQIVAANGLRLGVRFADLDFSPERSGGKTNVKRQTDAKPLLPAGFNSACCPF
jgi:hypothetical protein